MINKQVSLRRIVVLFVGVMAIGFLLIPVVDHVLTWYGASHFASPDSGDTLAVQPISDTSLLPVKSETPISIAGWQLAVPDATVASRTDRGSIATIDLSDGGRIASFGSLPDTAEKYREDAATRSLFPPAELASQAKFVSAAMSTIPSQVSFWNSRRHNARLMLLLLSKSIYTTSADAIHPISTPWMRGFEVEMKTRHGCGFHLLLFAQNNQALELVLFPHNPSQAWMNTLLTTVRPPRTAQLCPNTGCGS